MSSTFLGAQDVEFIVAFEDAIGNKDTITLGRNAMGTAGIDEGLGEVNIIDQPWSEGLDVRITDELFHYFSGNEHGTYHSKKQIIATDDFLEVSNINIKTDHYPVTARWDSSLFQVDGLDLTIMTSINPGGWWDTGSPSDLGLVFFKEQDSVSFSPNYNPNANLNGNYAFINEAGDSISVFWFHFYYHRTHVDDEYILQSDAIKIYPNPCSSFINLENLSSLKIEKVVVKNYLGQPVITMDDPEIMMLDVSQLKKGSYLLEIELEQGKKHVKPIVKI